MRKPAPTAKGEKRAEETRDDSPEEEAYKLLRRLANPASSWSIINWNDQEASRNPKAEFYAAVGFVDAVFGAIFNDSVTNDLGPFKDVALKQVLPALRRGRPPTRQKRGQHPDAFLLRDRWIAAVVDRICLQFGLNATRNEATEDKCGCSVIAEALKRHGFRRLSESQVETIWRRHRQ
jgi:hypothetical protein